MSLPLARTNSEAHAYMDLRPCTCGATDKPMQSAIVEADDDLASRYYGECPSCGAFREFMFRLPDNATIPAPGTVIYGDGTPSELLDPGEWLWLADRNGQAVPADLSNLDAAALRRARLRLSAARAALDEVLAFMPEDADSVPPDSFQSARGRAVYEREPDRFERTRLDITRSAYQQMLADVDQAIAEST